MKRCHKCKEAKQLDAFGRSSSSKDGRQAACRECKSAYYRAAADAYRSRNAERYAAQKDVIRERTRAYYWADPAPRRAVSRARYASLPGAEKTLAAQKAAERDREFPAQAAARVAIRRARLRRAVPQWLTKEQHAAIKSFYESAEALGMLLGEWHHVDHIVPLGGATVCGLHVPWNLQVLPAKENIRKLNRTWPHQP